MDSKAIDEAVGLWCEVTLVTDAKFEGVVYSYNPEQSLLVLMRNISSQGKKPSARIFNTKFIKSFDLKHTPDEGNRLPEQLDAFAVLPSMHSGKAKSLLKEVTSTLRDGENKRTKTLDPLDKADAPIGAFDVFVAVHHIFPGTTWNNETKSIKVSDMVYVEPDPTWEKPKVITRETQGKKAQRDDHAMVDRVKNILETME